MKPVVRNNDDKEKEPFILKVPIASSDNKKMRNRQINQSDHIDSTTFPDHVLKEKSIVHRTGYKWIFLILLLATITFRLHTRFFVMQRKHSGIFESIASRDYGHVNGIDELSAINDLVTSRCNVRMTEVCNNCENLNLGGIDRQGQRHWSKTVHENSDSAKSLHQELDVVFYGDSITEGWKGTSYGFDVGRKKSNPEVYESLFTLNRGGKYEGLVLGISGDTSANLLWRLQNGELPSSLNPTVFWLLIGTNDLGVSWCSAEVALIGILRVVEEIRAKKPGSIIVINGLLPRTFDTRKGFVTRKKNPGLGNKKNRPVLWNDIVEINKELEEYSKHHDGVEYFNPNGIFLVDETVSSKSPQINKRLMPDYLHPSARGYKTWGDKIVERLDHLIPKG